MEWVDLEYITMSGQRKRIRRQHTVFPMTSTRLLSFLLAKTDIASTERTGHLGGAIALMPFIPVSESIYHLQNRPRGTNWNLSSTQRYSKVTKSEGLITLQQTVPSELPCIVLIGGTRSDCIPIPNHWTFLIVCIFGQNVLIYQSELAISGLVVCSFPLT